MDSPLADCDIHEMEIRNYIVGDALKIHLAGRLDAFYSQQVTQHLDQAIQQGHKHIRLNLSELHYLSSAGIQALVHYHQELARMHGSLEVSNPSDTVRKVLSLSGLEALLAVPAPSVGEARFRTRDVAGTRFDVSSSTADLALQCRVVREGRNGERGEVSCWKDILVVGFGALAAGTAPEYFGPLFAAGGAALCLPAGAGETPDYMVAAGSFTPEVTLRNGVVCEGSLTVRAGFGSELTVGELAGAALEILGSDMGALVVLGNTASGEPVMAAGIAIRTPSKLLGSLMKPLTNGIWPIGSFCGALFGGGPVASFEGQAVTAIASFFKGRFESRVPHRILSGSEVAAARFAEGCLFAGAISSVVGQSEL
jgi:anti-anti-sigma factor